MKSLVVKRSIVVSGHKTSVSLEDAFWNALKEIAKARNVTLSELVAAIDGERQHENLSSTIRLFVLGVYRKQLADLKGIRQRQRQIQRAQVEIDPDSPGLLRALALVLSQKVEPPSCIRRAEGIGLLELRAFSASALTPTTPSRASTLGMRKYFGNTRRAVLIRRK